MNDSRPTPPNVLPASSEALALVQQLLSGLTGLPIATTVAKPLQFPSLQHLDEAVAATLAYAENVEGLSAKSTKGYGSSYRMFRQFLRDTRRVEAFLTGQLQVQLDILAHWIAWLRQRGANHTTVNTYWRALHALFARLSRAHACADPTQFMDAPKPGKPLARFLTRNALDEVILFVRNFQWRGGNFERARNIALLATMALGGCRKGEVLAMNVEDVDCSANTIEIHRGKGEHGGKGRIICMLPPLNRALTNYLALRQQRNLTVERLFVSVIGDKPIADITIRRLCAFVTRRTGVHVAPHILRHTCATLLLQLGVPDRLSMEQLGHASLGVLQRYSHIAPGERQRVIARLDFEIGDDPHALRDLPVGGTT